MGLFQNRPTVQGKKVVPVWFMRQAGRYHSHYQNIKKDSNFMQMCKDPNLACEITMGPIMDFDFDAAILFSDLLFPLERLGMGLSYESGPPTLEHHLHGPDDLKKLHTQKNFTYDFQGEATKNIRKALPPSKDLLGFTGAPFTLYAYACEGAHSGGLIHAKQGLYSGLYERFLELIEAEIIEQLSIQAAAGADALCLFDTAAGELTLDDYQRFSIPSIRRVAQALKKKFPSTRIIYYSKQTHLNYLQLIESKDIDVLGIDWRVNLRDALSLLGKDYYIQGNLDPAYLFLPWPILQQKLEGIFKLAIESKCGADKWIMGLGHGVMQKTPESNVKNAVKYIHENFLYR
ncbi:MAG: uroporphyrinogen decarboxylase [Bdellovibrio sp.]|nr:uroporphyrinogen decarboxylase [Bdellovibrio sp.]